MIAIPNMDKPEYCRVCHERLKCKQYDGEILHTPDDCPLIDIVRCGECKWSYIDERDGTLWCKVHFHHYRVNSDGFCSYGERRSNEFDT